MRASDEGVGDCRIKWRRFRKRFDVRKIAWTLVLLVPAATSIWAQQEVAPSTDDGPLKINPAPPIPDKNGVYTMGPGIVAPVLIHAVPAAFPVGIPECDVPHMSILSAVVGVDGVASKIKVVDHAPSECDDSAIDAVKRSQFEPGSLDGTPVPVRIYIRIPFLRIRQPIPRILERYPQNGRWQTLQGREPVSEDDPMRLQRGDTPPRPIKTVEAVFSDEARRKGIGGTVLISMVVDKDGVPTHVFVLKSVGYGLDENALKAARQYRFQPATHDGDPVAVRISVQVNFNLYKP